MGAWWSLIENGNGRGLTNPDNAFLNAWDNTIVSPCTKTCREKKETVAKFLQFSFPPSPGVDTISCPWWHFSVFRTTPAVKKNVKPTRQKWSNGKAISQLNTQVHASSVCNHSIYLNQYFYHPFSDSVCYRCYQSPIQLPSQPLCQPVSTSVITSYCDEGEWTLKTIWVQSSPLLSLHGLNQLSWMLTLLHTESHPSKPMNISA